MKTSGRASAPIHSAGFSKKYFSVLRLRTHPPAQFRENENREAVHPRQRLDPLEKKSIPLLRRLIKLKSRIQYLQGLQPLQNDRRQEKNSIQFFVRPCIRVNVSTVRRRRPPGTLRATSFCSVIQAGDLGYTLPRATIRAALLSTSRHATPRARTADARSPFGRAGYPSRARG